MPRYEKIKKLESVIGEKETLKAIWLCSGEHFHIPVLKSLYRDVRNEMIIRDYDRLISDGTNRPDLILSGRYALKPRRIFYIVKMMRRKRLEEIK